jgi:hypothetical protein
MKLVIGDPDFKHRQREPRYFIARLDDLDLGYDQGYRFQVQLLCEHGEGGAVVLFRGDEQPLRCDEYAVPEAVFRAALARGAGDGEYVTSTGEPCPCYWTDPRCT